MWPHAARCRNQSWLSIGLIENVGVCVERQADAAGRTGREAQAAELTRQEQDRSRDRIADDRRADRSLVEAGVARVQDHVDIDADLLEEVPRDQDEAGFDRDLEGR